MDNHKQGAARRADIVFYAVLVLMLVTIGVAMAALSVWRVYVPLALLMLTPLGLGLIEWIERDAGRG